ncbi:SAM-dependent methyltransferase, partial [Sporichthya sp.]|uniref:class I SAM-dependent methyltransferase n=1 Tax=Sporichthya sp. TaxID=65475 RepID=UPI001811591C
HGAAPPAWRRAELRPVELKDGRRLQQVCYDERQAHTSNLAYPAEAAAGVDALLAEPYGNWHVETAESTVQVRVTKKGQAQVHRQRAEGAVGPTAHDRVKPRLIDPGDPIFGVLGADAAKRRQVDAFLRLLAPTLDAVEDRAPLHVVDLGCGNAYLSFAAHRYLATQRAERGGARLTGVDLRDAARARNTAIAEKLSAADVSFVAGTIADAELPPGDLVLALHACDTATDDALARAVRWEAPVVIAAPCCHHETAAAIRAAGAPAPYGLLGKHGILRERMADVLTDALRATLLRLLGYRVDVVEFVSSEHTARNVAIRAVRTGAAADPDLVPEYRSLVKAWGLRPHLAVLLADELTVRHGGAW